LTVRLEAAVICLVLVGGACSKADSLGEYLDSVSEITLTMRNESIAAIPDGHPITRGRMDGVIDTRRKTTAALRALVPPSDVAPEHTALLGVLTEFSTDGERFMASTTDLDQAEFEQAVLAAIDLDAVAAKVGIACDAVERRAHDLGLRVDLAC